MVAFLVPRLLIAELPCLLASPPTASRSSASAGPPGSSDAVRPARPVDRLGCAGPVRYQGLCEGFEAPAHAAERRPRAASSALLQRPRVGDRPNGRRSTRDLAVKPVTSIGKGPVGLGTRSAVPDSLIGRSDDRELVGEDLSNHRVSRKRGRAVEISRDGNSPAGRPTPRPHEPALRELVTEAAALAVCRGARNDDGCGIALGPSPVDPWIVDLASSPRWGRAAGRPVPKGRRSPALRPDGPAAPGRCIVGVSPAGRPR